MNNTRGRTREDVREWLMSHTRVWLNAIVEEDANDPTQDIFSIIHGYLERDEPLPTMYADVVHNELRKELEYEIDNMYPSQYESNIFSKVDELSIYSEAYYTFVQPYLVEE